jgi:type IV secretion system protein VirB11
MGRHSRFEEVKRYCEGSVDLVVQLSRQGGRRGVAEIMYM